MSMLACTHHVSWLKPADGGKWTCGYCKSVVTKKDIYPKFDELGPTFQARWEGHEKGESLAPAPAPTAGGLTRS